MLIHNWIISIILLIVIRCMLINLESLVSKKNMSLIKPSHHTEHLLHNHMHEDDCNSMIDIGCCSECQKLAAQKSVGEKFLKSGHMIT